MLLSTWDLKNCARTSHHQTRSLLELVQARQNELPALHPWPAHRNGAEPMVRRDIAPALKKAFFMPKRSELRGPPCCRSLARWCAPRTRQLRLRILMLGCSLTFHVHCLFGLIQPQFMYERELSQHLIANQTASQKDGL